MVLVVVMELAVEESGGKKIEKKSAVSNQPHQMIHSNRPTDDRPRRPQRRRSLS